MGQDFLRHFANERGRAIWTTAFLFIVYLLLAYGTYSLFTSRTPSGNDFYSRWRGTRALLLEGKDPFSQRLTLEIRGGMYGRPAREDEDQVAFVCPLYVSFFILPLAFLPYPQAQALWLGGSVLLTLATIKPQIVFLLIPFLLLWALRWRRHRILGGFLAAMGILLLLPSLLLPTWLPSFWAGLSRYQAYTSVYTGGRSPLGILLDFPFSSKLSLWATLLISLVLGGYLVYLWEQVVKGREQFWPALFLTIIVTLLIPVQTGTTNQVLLLLPLIFWLAQWAERWWVATPLSLALLLGPWALFLVTVQGDAEQPVMFLPLPLFALLYLLAIGLRNSTALRGGGYAAS